MANVLNEKELIKFLNKNGRKDISIKLKHGLNFPKGTDKKVELFYMECIHERVITGEYNVVNRDGKTYVELTILRVFTFKVNMEPDPRQKPRYEFKTVPETTKYTIECDPSQIP